MCGELEFTCPAYSVKAGFTREQKVYFSYPELIDNNTGIMLLVSGFDGNPEANVYRKMRSLFASQYNLVVVQTSYLGIEFMGNCEQFSISALQLQKLQQELPLDIKKEVFREDGQLNLRPLMDIDLPIAMSLQLDAVLNETDNNFVEMGAIQAIDCMRALQAVYDIVRDNGFEIDYHKILVYGHSHGAYLAHLCNRFFPNVFSLVLDSSAWISPVYLNSSRILTQRINKLTMHKVFTYRIGAQNYDHELYDLGYLYRGFKNNANIVIYQGVTDNLIDHNTKKSIFKQVEHITFNMITDDKVDGVVIKSTNHGDIDFIELFHKEAREHHDLFIIEKEGEPFCKSEIVKTSKAVYKFHFDGGIPGMTISPRLCTITQ